MSAQDSLGSQFTLYRGEGSHDRPSYYPKTGPQSGDAGGWWTSNQDSARRYAQSTTAGQVYRVDVAEHEAEPRGARGNFFISDLTVRDRRSLHTGGHDER